MQQRMDRMEREMAGMKDRMKHLETLSLADCYKYESEAFVFRLAIEEFYRKKKKEIEESKADETSKQQSLNALNRWFEEAKAKRRTHILVSSGVGGAIAAAGVAVAGLASGACAASVAANVAVAVGAGSTATATGATGGTAIAAAGATFGAIPVVALCVIVGVGAFLLLAGGMYAYVEIRDWWSRDKSEVSKKDK